MRVTKRLISLAVKRHRFLTGNGFYTFQWKGKPVSEREYHRNALLCGKKK
jgi:hypothetical protein